MQKTYGLTLQARPSRIHVYTGVYPRPPQSVYPTPQADTAEHLIDLNQSMDNILPHLLWIREKYVFCRLFATYELVHRLNHNKEPGVHSLEQAICLHFVRHNPSKRGM